MLGVRAKPFKQSFEGGSMDKRTSYAGIAVTAMFAIWSFGNDLHQQYMGLSDHVFRTDEPEIQPDLKKARYRKWRDFGAGLNDRDIAAKASARRFSHLL